MSGDRETAAAKRLAAATDQAELRCAACFDPPRARHPLVRAWAWLMGPPRSFTHAALSGLALALLFTLAWAALRALGAPQ